MKKKIVIGIATFVALVGIAFCASCYKYTYNISIKCKSCYGQQTFTVEADDDTSARHKAYGMFTGHSSDCSGRTYDYTIISKHTNDYTDCD